MNVTCFRLDCNSSIGGGHLKRCLNISQIIPQKQKIIFLIEINKNEKKNVEKQLIIKKNYEYIFLEKFTPIEEEKLLIKINNNYSNSLFLFDISNKEKIKKIKKVKLFFSKIQTINRKIIIDSVKGEALLPFIKNYKLETVVTPYENAKKYYGSFTHLIGRNFFCHDPNLKPKNTVYKNKIKKILISFGNSDKKKISLFCIKSLNTMLELYNTKLVIGPLFDKGQTKKLVNLAKKNKNLELVFNINNLSDLYNWCDLLIGSCGNTKYEFIIFKKPFIIIPHNHISEKQITSFKKEKICLVTKNIDKLNKVKFKKTFNNFINNKKKIRSFNKQLNKIKISNNEIKKIMMF